jgi:GT2 family glycosyltransferase
MHSQKNIPKVDIIILTFNCKNDTLECLASLRKINYPQYRVTVVDNGSKNGSQEAIIQKFPEVNYLFNPKNLRFAGGNNVALRNTLKEGFDYALLLNNDTIVDPNFLSEMVKGAETDPAIGLVGPKIYYYEHPKVIWFAGGKADIRFAYMRHIGIGQTDGELYSHPREVNFLNGACVLVKCEVMRKIGFLDESFFLYNEDFDFCLRAIKAGYKLYYQPQAIIWHKVSRTTGHWKKLWYRYQSGFQLLKKHTPVYWRPLQFGNMFLEFVPLLVGFLVRKIKFLLHT